VLKQVVRVLTTVMRSRTCLCIAGGPACDIRMSDYYVHTGLEDPCHVPTQCLASLFFTPCVYDCPIIRALEVNQAIVGSSLSQPTARLDFMSVVWNETPRSPSTWVWQFWRDSATHCTCISRQIVVRVRQCMVFRLVDGNKNCCVI
jgi:hypothetical protein